MSDQEWWPVSLWGSWRLRVLLLAAMCLSGCQYDPVRQDPACGPLRAFVESVKPDETRAIAFHTRWGSGFKGNPEFVLLAKQCDHGGYAPGRAACKALLEVGSAEFPGINAQDAVICLVPTTRFPSHGSLEGLDLSTYYGNDDRGSAVRIQLGEDKDLGGAVLRITADGYGP